MFILPGICVLGTRATHLTRKLLLCSIARNDLDTARSIFFSMPAATQRDPMTRYLLYKISVRSGDRSLATECLEIIAASTAGQEILYACAVDSQQSGDRACVVECLKKLAASYDYKTPNPVHLPALFRCNIRMLYDLIKDEDQNDQQSTAIQDLCDLFDGGRLLGPPRPRQSAWLTLRTVIRAMEENPVDKDGRRLFDTAELDWFSRNAYNIGVQHSSRWNMRYTTHLLTSCVRIISKFPSGLASEVAGDLSLKTMFCHFMISSALAALARAEDQRDQQRTDYRAMRMHIAAFDSELQARLGALGSKPAEDMLNKLSILFVFDLEAAIALEEWKQLDEVVRKAAICKKTTMYQAMGDCLLRSNVPREGLSRHERVPVPQANNRLRIEQSSSLT